MFNRYLTAALFITFLGTVACNFDEMRDNRTRNGEPEKVDLEKWRTKKGYLQLRDQLAFYMDSPSTSPSPTATALVTTMPTSSPSATPSPSPTETPTMSPSPSPSCYTPTAGDIQKILDYIKNNPEYEYLVDHATDDPCWRNGCFLRRVIIFKILQDIFNDPDKINDITGGTSDGRPWCDSGLCYMSQVYPQDCNWSWHTVPAYYPSGDIPYDPSGNTTIPSDEFICIETYGKEFLQCQPGGTWCKSPSGALCNIMPNPSNPSNRPKPGESCDLYVTTPNCTFKEESLDDLKARSIKWCTCAKDMKAQCQYQHPGDKPAADKCQKEKIEQYCVKWLSSETEPPSFKLMETESEYAECSCSLFGSCALPAPSFSPSEEPTYYDATPSEMP